MPFLEVDIGHVQLQEECCYQLVFQGQHCTEVAAPNSGPTFHSKTLKFFAPDIGDKIEVHVAIVAHSTKSANSKVLSEARLLFQPSESIIQYRWDPVLHLFADAGSHAPTQHGIVHFSYKSISSSITDIVHGCETGDYLLNISVGFLHTLVEHPFEVTLRVLNSSNHTVAMHHFNNSSCHMTMPFHPQSRSDTLLVTFKELSEQSTLLGTSLCTQGIFSGIFSLTLQSKEVLVITVNLLPMSDDDRLLTLVHSSVMREATWTVGGAEHKPRVSLTPRRKSTLNDLLAGASHAEGETHIQATPTAAAGAAGTLISSASKSLCYLFWQHSDYQREDINLIEHICQLYPVEGTPPRVPSQTQTQTQTGAFVLVTSKSDIVEADSNASANIVSHKKKGRSKRRELHNVHLGLLLLPMHLPPPRSNNSNSSSRKDSNLLLQAMQLHMQLLDTSFGDAVTKVMSCLVKYSGVLAESSRELFSENSLLSCTLEGNLLPAGASPRPQPEAKGSCMVCKTYVSLLALGRQRVNMNNIVFAPNPPAAIFEADAGIEAETELDTGAADIATVVAAAVAAAKPELVQVAAPQPPQQQPPQQQPPQQQPPQQQPPQQLNHVEKQFMQHYAQEDQHNEQALQAIKQHDAVYDSDELRSESRLDMPLPPLHQAKQRLAGNTAVSTASMLDQGKLQSLSHVISQELHEKQAMIERLLDELSIKSEAIAVCGQDIRELREDKAMLRKQLEEAQAAAAAVVTVARPRTPSPPVPTDAGAAALSGLSKHSLIHMVLKLQSHVHEQDTEQSHLQEQIHALHAQHRQHEAAVKVHDQQQMQQAQQLAIHGKEMRKLAQYRDTIEMQEKLIVKLQNMMESKLRSKFVFSNGAGAGGAGGAAGMLEGYHTDKETRRLRQELEESREQVQRLQEDVDSLHRELTEQAQRQQYNAAPSSARSVASSSSNKAGVEGLSPDAEAEQDSEGAKVPNLAKARMKIDQLVAESISKTYRVEALERQLDSASRDAAREIGRLRTRLLELEIQLALAQSSSSFSDESDGERFDERADSNNDMAKSGSIAMDAVLVEQQAVDSARGIPKSVRSARSTTSEAEAEHTGDVLEAENPATRPGCSAAAAPACSAGTTSSEPLGQASIKGGSTATKVKDSAVADSETELATYTVAAVEPGAPSAAAPVVVNPDASSILEFTIPLRDADLPTPPENTSLNPSTLARLQPFGSLKLRLLRSRSTLNGSNYFYRLDHVEVNAFISIMESTLAREQHVAKAGLLTHRKASTDQSRFAYYVKLEMEAASWLCTLPGCKPTLTNTTIVWDSEALAAAEEDDNSKENQTEREGDIEIADSNAIKKKSKWCFELNGELSSALLSCDLRKTAPKSLEDFDLATGKLLLTLPVV